MNNGFSRRHMLVGLVQALYGLLVFRPPTGAEEPKGRSALPRPSTIGEVGYCPGGAITTFAYDCNPLRKPWSSTIVTHASDELS